jgi:hypothetical protein
LPPTAPGADLAGGDPAGPPVLSRCAPSPDRPPRGTSSPTACGSGSPFLVFKKAGGMSKMAQDRFQPLGWSISLTPVPCVRCRANLRPWRGCLRGGRYCPANDPSQTNGNERSRPPLRYNPCGTWADARRRCFYQPASARPALVPSLNELACQGPHHPRPGADPARA